MRVMKSKPHLLRDNPLLRELESVGNKDPEYSSIVHAIRTGQGNKSLPSDSEAYKMGGEWSSMSIMDKAEIICISGADRFIHQKGLERRSSSSYNKEGSTSTL